MDEAKARDIPQDVAICPICGAQLWIEGINEVFEEGNTLQVSDMTITCKTEPEIESGDWDYWHRQHFSTPYIDWLPVQKKLEQWINQSQQDRIKAIWGST